MAKKVKRRQELELTVENVAFGGKGIARLDDYVIFVQNTLPGDRVLARIRKAKSSFAEAYPLEILEPSKLRGEAPCQHFGVCGGCKWQNVEYEQQLLFKHAHVEESLHHIGKVFPDIIHPVMPASPIYSYRNKMEFSFTHSRWLTSEELEDETIKKDFGLGFHVPGHFDRILNVEKCYLQGDVFNGILNLTQDFFRTSDVPVYHLRSHEGVLRFLVLRQSFAKNQVLVNLVTSKQIPEEIERYAEVLCKAFPQVSGVVNTINSGKAQVATGSEFHVIRGSETIFEMLGDLTFEISVDSFFQTNSVQALELYKTVAKYAELDGEVIWDLYCGTGSIAIFLAKQAKRVVGFEIVENAVKDAYRNAKLNGVDNCEFVSGDLRYQLRDHADNPPDVLICDPPRAGMHKDVLEEMLRLSPKRIVYVSCNPATMARDLAELAKAYKILEVQPVDMFPHTYHIESVAKLERL
ncbi:MAG: 23S rRNA (uracil(1939)-C(5))-methyltransferase RlmD [Calditrichia bacterium]